MTQNDPVAEYYMQHHAGGSGRPRYGFSIGMQQRAEWLLPKMPKGVRILDIGCRDGTFTKLFASGNEVLGVDVDPCALHIARRDTGIETLEWNMNNGPLPLEDGSRDLIFLGEVLEHLQFPDLILADIRRVLRTGGLFLGSVPNAFRLVNRLKFLFGKDFEEDPTHLHHFSQVSLRRHLAAFKNVQVDWVGSRHLWLSRRLMGTVMMWSAEK